MPEVEEEDGATKGVTEAEEGGSRADVEEGSKEEEEAGAGRDLSPSTRTWGRSRPSCSSCRAQLVPFLTYVHYTVLPFLILPFLFPHCDCTSHHS